MNRYIIILVVLLSSCMTRKSATKNLDRIQRNQPIALVEKCASIYQPIDSVKETIIYKPGTIIKDTVKVQVRVDCDSAKKVDPKIKYVYTLCPPNQKIVDTVYRQIATSKSNKYLEILLSYQKDSVVNQLNITQDKLSKRNKQLTWTSSVLGSILIGFLLWILIKVLK